VACNLGTSKLHVTVTTTTPTHPPTRCTPHTLIDDGDHWRVVLRRVPKPTDDEDAYDSSVRKYLLKGGDIDARHEHAERGLTMLMCSSTRGFLKTVDHLIVSGASLNLHAGSGKFTALMYATRSGHDAVVKKLLQAGAAVDIKDSLGRTALLQSRGPDSMQLGSDVYCMCVPPTAGVNRCVDLLRERMGLPALAVEEREHRVQQPGDIVGVRGGAVAVDDGNDASALHGSMPSDSSVGEVDENATNESATPLCEACGAPGKLRCGACKSARYCSASCQRTSWREHKLVCRRVADAS
jgi:hypothetical protein